MALAWPEVHFQVACMYGRNHAAVLAAFFEPQGPPVLTWALQVKLSQIHCFTG